MRPETGPMRFDGDWTGVFVRGDDCFAHATALRDILDVFEHDLGPRSRAELTSLICLLESSRDTPPITSGRQVQELRDFATCSDSGTTP